MEQKIFSEQRFEQLFNLWFEDLMRYVCSYVRDEDIAKDVVHDVFLTIWKNRRTLDLSWSLKAYLFTLARNYALNYLRHRKVIAANEPLLTENIQFLQQELDAYEARMNRLENKLRELPRQQRQSLELCIVRGKTYQQAADELHISVNTIKTHLRRALTFLRTQLQNDLTLIFLLKKHRFTPPQDNL